jgi:prepilin-type N-terminal cleavage/methylation domain-containing protein/prepilin-type processing-associated H-X9-DG protein
MSRKIIEQKSGFTLIELLVVVAVIAVLAALALPAIRNAQAQSLSVKCASNMMQLGKATLLYASDNELRLPDSSHGIDSWTNALQPYASGTITFKCPADEAKGRIRTFVINDYLTARPCNAEYLSELNQSRLVCVEKPSQTVFFMELSKGYGPSRPPDHLHLAQYYPGQIGTADFATQVGVERHPGRKANYLFADAHCESLTWTDVQARMVEPGSRFITSIPTE